MQRNPTASLANQMKMRDREMVPRFLVQAMFALMIGALALVAYARLTDRPLEGTRPAAAILDEVSLTMVGDRASGVALFDMNGVQVAHSNDSKKGFIDVIWVSINRERALRGADVAAPIRVVRQDNGQVAILDDATGWSIVLIGYGQDNVAAFADLLDS
ncbi:putative photosynthetic complex assembly protein [Jannaschia faecimaris]|uniref:Putative photosynthetic complex assembly protein n=1 Tax=Jannaschia faecimaris TaxID=1244108 RepID=A0A1H3TCH6_9RHOB|nr:photosynthetic complex assembly protein PuhC [Jannaschia faecimaris]SDZ47924.1 putative photosynthetic complex assembly protein [Jannaschia faecimaris]